MRRAAVVMALLLALLLAGCGAASRSHTYEEVDWGGYVIQLAGTTEQCPGELFEDCRLRWHQSFVELHVKTKQGAGWMPVSGAMLVGMPHP